MEPRVLNAMAYVLLGRGHVGEGQRPVSAHELAVFGPGGALTVGAKDELDVLLLGGLPIREPIAHYGPFLMNTKAQILEAIDDFNAGKMGTIPAR